MICISVSLRGSSPGRSCGGAGKGRRTYHYVRGIWIPLPIPLWLPVYWAVRFPPISAKRERARMQINIEKRMPWVMTSLLMSSPPHLQSASKNLHPGRGDTPLQKWRGCLSENFENTPKRYQNLVLRACPRFISTPKRYQFNNNKLYNWHCKF